MATIEVINRLNIALDIQVGTRTKPDPAGESFIKDTHVVTLRPGTNWVDEEFWKKWYADHKGSDLAQHLVAVDKLRPTPAPATARPSPPPAASTRSSVSG